MPTLIVLRHAKAATPLGIPDFDRPLAGRGVKDAEKAGAELRAAGLVPDAVICSPALRTRQTLERLGVDAPVEYDSRVYDNDAEEILDLLRGQSGDTLLLVGHNPSMHQLVFGLSGGAEARFPTSATAVIGFEGDWADLWPGAARLISLWTPDGK
jgi:phosphohistidine phosphatase